MRSESGSSGTPWYHHSWPWFIVILLGVSVLGSLATVVIAYRHRDVDVRDTLVPAPSAAERSAPDAAPDLRNRFGEPES